jgi:hypothetical protein
MSATREPRDVTRFPQILILTLVAIFGMSHGGKDLPDVVAKVVAKDRRESAVAAAKDVVAVRKEMAEAIRASRVAFYERLGAVPLDRTRLEVVFKQLDDRTTELQEAGLDARFALRDAMTKEEWKKLFEKLDK